MAYKGKAKGPVPHPHHEVMMVPVDRAGTSYSDSVPNAGVSPGLVFNNPSSVPPQNMAY